MPKLKYTIHDMIELAAKKNGKCLSTTFKGVKVRLWWECKDGHKWESYPSNILNDNWCRICAGHPILDVAHCQEIALKMGGKFLSDVYKNRKIEYDWECKNSHIFSASLNSIKYENFWCKKCSGREDLTIESLQETAAKLGGKCLSTEYHGVGAFYDWECASGHTWNAIGQNVRYGFWCGYCLESFSERTCRSIDGKFP